MENILVDAQGHIKIADFGLALESAGSGVFHKKICGTPTYTAPEVTEHKYFITKSIMDWAQCIGFHFTTPCIRGVPFFLYNRTSHMFWLETVEF